MYKSLLISTSFFMFKSSFHHSSRPQRLVRVRERRDESSLVKIAQQAERSTVPGIQWLTFRTSKQTSSTTTLPPTQCPHQAHGEEDPGRSKKNQILFMLFLINMNIERRHLFTFQMEIRHCFHHSPGHLWKKIRILLRNFEKNIS